jgi:hypothetical protein
MINVQQELNTLSDALTDAVKDVIKSKGLVATGALYNSIRVIPQYSNGKLSLDIEAEDYFGFLDEKYQIMETALRDGRWDSAIENVMFEIINKEIEDTIR